MKSPSHIFFQVLVQLHQSPSGGALASTSGLRASSSARDVLVDEDDDEDVEIPMEEEEEEEEEDSRDNDEDEDATIMVVKRGKKSGGRTGSTWPRQNEAPTTSQTAGGNSTAVAATHPRGRK